MFHVKIGQHAWFIIIKVENCFIAFQKYIFKKASYPWGLTLVFPGRPRHSVGSMCGHLQQQPQEHPQHTEPHVRLRQLRHCEVSSARRREKRSEPLKPDEATNYLTSMWWSSSQADLIMLQRRRWKGDRHQIHFPHTESWQSWFILFSVA